MWAVQLKEALVDAWERPTFSEEDACVRLGENQAPVPCGGILRGFDVGDPREGP